MNVFWRELKATGKSLFIWCIGMVFLLVAGMVKFDGSAASGQSLNEVIDKMPKILKAVFGLGSFDLSTISGYYGVMYMYVLVMATIYAAMLGGTLLSKEKQDKTAEFLFVKPISRGNVIAAKWSAGFVNIVIFAVVTAGTSVWIVKVMNKGASITNELLTLMIGMFLVQLVFYTFAFFISTVSSNPKAGVTVSTSVLLVAFFLSIFMDMSDKVDWLKYVTPFKYFPADSVLSGNGLGVGFVLFCLVVIGALSYLSRVFFGKRDIV